MKLHKASLIIVGLSLALRLAIVSHATWLPVSDTRTYHVLAYNLAQGNGYFEVYEGDSPNFFGMTQRASRVPGYPIFLAAIYRCLSWDPYWAYLANVACEVATSLLIVVIGGSIFDRRIAMAAQAFFGLHVLWTPNLMTESLFTLLFATLAYLILRGKTASIPGALCFGGLLAIAVLVRPIAIACVALLFFRELRVGGDIRRRFLNLVLLFLPLAIALGLWSARNDRALGKPVVLSTNFGAHNAAAFGLDKRKLIREARIRGLGEVEIDELLRNEIRQAVVAAPLAALRVYLSRVAGMFLLQPAWEVGFLQQETFAGPRGSPLVAAVYRRLFSQYYFVYPLAMVGCCWVAASRKVRYFVVLVLAFAALHALVSDANIRFAAPIHPFLCLLAGYGSLQLYGLVRNRTSDSASPGL